MTATALPDLDGPAPIPPGVELLPGYRIIEHIRRGADLDVYDAWSEDRYTRCFLKTVRPDRVGHHRLARRLTLEGRLLLSFTHPHLVRAYELGTAADGAPVLVLETLSGATLTRLLDGDGPERSRLATQDLAHLGRHVCSAIRYLHRRGYLHLDVKTSNVIADAGRAKLIDLSLARRPGRCRPGYGTSIYMAPEQAVGGVVGPAADVWGIGLLLFEAATGVRPFDTDDEPSTADEYRQVTEVAPAVSGLRRLPRPLGRTLDACLRPDPAERPTLAELIAALETITGRDYPD